MKHKLLMTALAVATCLGSHQELQAQSLKATLTDVKNDTIIARLIDVDKATQQKLDTIVATNGSFEYTLRVPTATRADFYIKDGLRSGRPYYKSFMFVLVPGEQAIMTGSTEKYTLTGTPFFKEYGKVEAQIDKYDEKLDSIDAKYRPLLAAAENDTAAANKLQEDFAKAYMAVRQVRTKFIEDYIKANPNRETSVALIPELGWQRSEEAVAWLTAEARECRLAPVYKTGLAILQEEKETERQIEAMNGKPAPAVELTDINGKPFTLTSLKGKYVVLDFWGSWCGWCIKGIPEMKKSYAKYKDKMEIVGIDCRDTDAKWKAAVKKHEIPWTHVYNPNSSDLTERYHITGFPTKVIVDPQGNIVRTVIGEDPEFYTFLDELFK